MRVGRGQHEYRLGDESSAREYLPHLERMSERPNVIAGVAFKRLSSLNQLLLSWFRWPTLSGANRPADPRTGQ